jgi:RNA ligase (TIGR02306 family)
MTEWCPQVVRIEKIEKHPNADNLSIATVMGNYPVIIKTNQYQQDQLASYIPIDTMANLDLPEFSFLDKSRIRARRLRGIYSQGLLVDAPIGFKEGDSLLDHFGLKKYVYPEEVEDLMGLSDDEKKYYYFPKMDTSFISKIRGRNAAPPPKNWAAPYYDLDSVRKYGHIFKDGDVVICTEKCDGCNAFYRNDGEQFFVKSRNFYKKRPDESNNDSWWEIAIRLDFENKFAKFTDYGFYGELYGHVNPFFYDCEIVDGKIQNKFRIFDIYDFKKNCFLDYDDMVGCAKDVGIETMPLIYRGPWKQDKSLYSLVEGNTHFNLKLPNATNIMEGMVIRPEHEINDPHIGRVSLKLKSERYNLFKK